MTTWQIGAKYRNEKERVLEETEKVPL